MKSYISDEIIIV